MIDTKAFKTRSEIIERKMPRINGNNQYKAKTIIALDAGYSGVKGASPNKVFTFPTFAKKAPKSFETIGRLKPTDIQYRDNNTGDIWLVGELAERLISSNDVNSITDDSLFSRCRWRDNDDIFRVCVNTGLALGLMGTGAGNEIFLQTGLPAEYKDRDEKILKKYLAKDYDLSIKTGNSDWIDFKFTLDEEHIDVMSQPYGTLCACAYNNGVATPLGLDLLKNSTLVWDIGFGTEDIINIVEHVKSEPKTFTDTGMRAVFQQTIARITDIDADAECKVFEIQKYLEDGKVPYMDMSDDDYKMRYINIADILEDVNNALCKKSIDRLMLQHNNLKGYNNLIVTGGTGESRFEYTRKKLMGIEGLRIIPANINTPDLGFGYSNVIGYYNLRYAKLCAEAKKMGVIV